MSEVPLHALSVSLSLSRARSLSLHPHRSWWFSTGGIFCRVDGLRDLHRGTSFIRERNFPSDHHRSLGIGLLVDLGGHSFL